MNSINILLLASGAVATHLRGNAEKQAPLYVFGYGSLMSESSRIRTECNLPGISEDTLEWLLTHGSIEAVIASEEARKCIADIQAAPMFAVNAKGIRRGWFAHQSPIVSGPEWADQQLFVSPTYLGAVADKDASVYGYMYEVSKDSLASTDARETAGYSFATLTSSDIEVVASSIPDFKLAPNAQVRVYLNREAGNVPSERSPIVQSYVDLFLGGALDTEAQLGAKGYALNVCRTTFGWGHHWRNDRPFPYRAFSANTRASEINALLLACAQSNSSIRDTQQQAATPLFDSSLQSIRIS